MGSRTVVSALIGGVRVGVGVQLNGVVGWVLLQRASAPYPTNDDRVPAQHVNFTSAVCGMLTVHQNYRIQQITADCTDNPVL